jgi:hypothetical protein
MPGHQRWSEGLNALKVILSIRYLSTKKTGDISPTKIVQKRKLVRTQLIAQDSGRQLPGIDRLVRVGASKRSRGQHDNSNSVE